MARVVLSVWVALVVCASCGGGEPAPADEAADRAGELVAIAVYPSPAVVLVGQTQQFTATAVFSDQSTRDVTNEVTWSSSGDSATISNDTGTRGLATARSVSYYDQSAAISASMAGVTASAAMTTLRTDVASIAVTTSGAPAVALTKHQFRAVATYSDGRTEDVTERAFWRGFGSALATFSFDQDIGEADLLTAGDLTVQANFGSVGYADLQVAEPALESFVVTPDSLEQPLGEAFELHAIATLAGGETRDLTQIVSWQSSDPDVASMTSPPGSAQSVALGTTTIRATYGSFASESTMTVIPPVVRVINLAPTEGQVSPGATQAFAATGFLSDRTPVVVTDAVWRSSNPAVATISATGVATGVGPGTTDITAEVGTTVGSATLLVVGPTVETTFPADGAIDVRPTTSIVVRFDRAMARVSVTVQAQDGPCSGSLQLSADDFATCHGFAGAVTFDAAGKVASAQPGGLTAATPWKVRVTSAAKSTRGEAVGPYIQSVGFTAAAGTCGPRLQISQVYSGGGNAGSSFDADFIEVHNTGASDIELFGYSVQYSAAGSSAWTVTRLPGYSLPAGGYFLVAVLRDRPSANLPAPDYNLLIGEMAPGVGKVAIVSTFQSPPGVCPIDLTNDLVGYGGTDCFEGAAPAGALGNTLAARRGVDGCGDTGNNAVDFTTGTPTPRNTASPPHVCACP